MFGKVKNAFKKARAWLRRHPYVVMAAMVPARVIATSDLDFSEISDLLMSILPIILVVSVFGALVGMFRNLGRRLGGRD